MTSPSDHDPADDRPIASEDDLLELFHAAEKPPSAWRIGAEAEKFGVDAETGAPLGYDGERGVLRIFSALIDAHGWEPERETPNGPIISLRRGAARVTLEPGAQLELSGAALNDVHAICAEMRAHLGELRAISSEMNLIWLGVGFHPFARQEDLPWVPKQRYAIMKRYLPTRGSGALDMMRRTATVQANYDFSSEEDAIRKLRVSLRLSPLANAMLANSPFHEGGLAHKKSVRGEIWLRMDPARSGLIPRLWTQQRAGYRDYAEWALDAGMFLIKRGDRVLENTGQPFRSFLADGYQGERATRADWKLHLATLFPEVRMKNTLEIRACDSLPTDLACAMPALFAGILYDARALEQAEELVAPFSYEQVERARPALVVDGLGADIAGRPARELAERVLEISSGGLERRARLTPGGRDERVHLRRLTELSSAGKSPADVLTAELSDNPEGFRREILSRLRL
jgi:glutamate--cysteine ligase